MNTIFAAIFCVGLLPNPSVIEDNVPVLEVAHLIHENEGLEASGICYIFRDKNGAIIESKYVGIEDGWNTFWFPYGRPLWDRNVVEFFDYENNWQDQYTWCGIRKIRADVVVETVNWESRNPANWEAGNLLPSEYRAKLSPAKPRVKDIKYWMRFIDFRKYQWDLFY